MSEALPDEPRKAQERSPEEEAAHLLKKAAKQREKAEKRAKRRLSLVAITLSVFLSWLGSTVFVTIHGMLANELSVSHARVKLALASYSVALIMAAVAGGRLADILGRKRMFIIGGLAFSAAELLGLTVTNLWSLVAVRAFAGLSAALVLTATGGVLVSTVHGTTRHDGWLLWRGGAWPAWRRSSHRPARRFRVKLEVAVRCRCRFHADCGWTRGVRDEGAS